jgi:phosphoglycerol geranylgeranyltransferase
MSAPWADWDHIVKLDPDKTLVDGETFEDVCATGTDAIEVGGTTGIDEDKMAEVIDACAAYDVPLYIEPNHFNSVVHHEGLDGYLIPTVFNAGDMAWVVGAHKEWTMLDQEIDWDHTWTEAYIVLNPDSSVAQVTEAECDLDPDEVAAYTTVAERLFGQEIIYIEYSGTLGDPDIVRAAQEALDDGTLFYGGGIHDYDSAYQMGEHADTVVVGDLVHDAGVDAVRETVEGAKDARAEAASEH